MNDLIDIALNSLWPPERVADPVPDGWEAWAPYADIIDAAINREWP